MEHGIIWFENIFVKEVNENKYEGELNSIGRVLDFLTRTYLDPTIRDTVSEKTGENFKSSNNAEKLVQYKTNKGIIEIPACLNFRGQPVYLNGRPAPDGVYSLDFFNSITVKGGFVI